jgi:hypothetical protein
MHYVCRHCPFGHVNVKDERKRTAAITRPTLLRLAANKHDNLTPGPGRVDVVFWSGVCATRLPWPVLHYHHRINRDIVHGPIPASQGKDSYLALLALDAEAVPRDQTVLLTTFAEHTRVIPHQVRAVTTRICTQPS